MVARYIVAPGGASGAISLCLVLSRFSGEVILACTNTQAKEPIIMSSEAAQWIVHFVRTAPRPIPSPEVQL